MPRLLLLITLLLAFALRVYALDAKGLSYDEAATALMARATPGEILAFHWRAAFEHPPVWQLLMHGWSRLVGQSEFALRYLSVLAGTLLLPLLFQFARRLTAHSAPSTIHHSLFPIHHSLLILATGAPILIYYSQEARMYSLVVTLAVAGTTALFPLVGTRYTLSLRGIARFLLLHWIMLGLHYYSVLLVLAEGIFCLIRLVATRAAWRQWRAVIGTLGVALLPLLIWLAFAPGFHDTLRMTLADTTPKPDSWRFLGAFWRELSFASVRWEVAQSVWGYLWLPLVGLGLVAVIGRAIGVGRHRIYSTPEPQNALKRVEDGDAGTLLWLPVVAVIVPIGVSALLFPTLATRYLLYVVPFLLVLMALGIGWLGQWHRGLAVAGLLIALVVPAPAVPHYFGPYQKSAYREMTTYLTTHRQPQEAVLLEAPRQHLLAKYYLPPETPVYPAPAIELPPFWPVNAPPVVPEAMDDVIQGLLRDYQGVWLSLTAENEVDPGEFVPKYLTAVAYPRDCEQWLDVRLCHFISPRQIDHSFTTRTETRFADELLLHRADLAVMTFDETPFLLATLHWQALQQPAVDYRVTLRLIDPAGQAVLSQRDSYPIGPLLPPTTWNAGDEKPGYMMLPVPTGLAAGSYQFTANLYAPADAALVPYRQATADEYTTAPLILALLTIGDTITLSHP